MTTLANSQPIFIINAKFDNFILLVITKMANLSFHFSTESPLVESNKSALCTMTDPTGVR